MELAKREPGKYSYASYGSGSQPHLAGEMLKSAAGIDPDVETHAWFALFVPAATPRPVVERINRDAVAIVNDPEYRQKELVDKGYDPVGNRPDEFAAYMKRDLESRGRAVKLSGARAE